MTESPAAAWMDRLSDRVLALIPGGSRMPPRHPIKVSVVMGGLGLLSGWATMLLGMTASWSLMQAGFGRETPIFVTAGAVLAVIVVSPWAIWLGMKRRWLLLLVPYAFLGNLVSFGVIEQLRSKDEFGLFLFGSLTGLYLSTAGQVLIRRFKPFWLLSTSLISGLGLASFGLIKDQTLLRQLLPRELSTALIIAWFFSLIHTPSALCLGYLLWDATPRPKLPLDSASP